jgi:hypothetical protein
LKVLKDACTLCLANQDDPNDKSLDKVCKPGQKEKATIKDQKDALLKNLKKGDQ